jgi:hypothetical protein
VVVNSKRQELQHASGAAARVESLYRHHESRSEASSENTKSTKEEGEDNNDEDDGVDGKFIFTCFADAHVLFYR